MIESFLEIPQLLKNETIKIKNKYLNEIVKNFSFLNVSKNIDIQLEQNEAIIQNIKDSKVIIINETNNNQFMLICFKKTIIIIDKSFFYYLNDLISQNTNLKLCCLSKNEISAKQAPYLLKIPKILCNSVEIRSFANHLSLQYTLGPSINNVWQQVTSCISTFLIKQSYLSIKYNRIKNFYNNENQNELINANDFNDSHCVYLRNIGIGSVFRVDLFYHIQNEKLYAKKVQHIPSTEITKLLKREINNYMNIQHPFLPKFYCLNEAKHYSIIEFINGKALSSIKELNLTENDKFSIIFELMITIDYLHHKNYIIRDLKPNNIIIDENKNAIIIDFDRMINKDEISDNQVFTSDFQSNYTAEELKLGNFSYEKCDVFSFGMILCFIMTEKTPNNPESLKYGDLKEMYQKCINKIPEKRPTLSNLIIEFFINHFRQIKFTNYFEIEEDYLKTIYEPETIKTMKNLAQKPNDPETQVGLGFIYGNGKYVKRDIDKACEYFSFAADQNHESAKLIINCFNFHDKYIIHDVNQVINYLTPIADHNNVIAQFTIGYLYANGEYISQNLNKALHYLSLAANQNFINAQIYLGEIFTFGFFGFHDINKGIYYLSQAANQNNAEALNFLGEIYFNKQFGVQDISKALNYYIQATNLNSVYAQCRVGSIYHDGINVMPDIKKAIHYYTLAANQNFALAQYQLGLLYENGESIERNINKAIFYYTLAANQNFALAQQQLGLLYEQGQYVKRDIQKAIQFFTPAAKKLSESQFQLGKIYHLSQRDFNNAIHYYTLAANQNHPQAQYNLADLYYYIKDYQKALHYYQLSAAQNNVYAQYNLGILFYEGIFVKKDINKAIEYFSRSANQNYVESIFYLFRIYAEGKEIPQNLSKAVHYLEMAAKLNDPRAQFNLGFMYHEGRLTTRDINKAMYYYNLAANQNFDRAQYNLAVLYFDGKYIKRDINKAIKYLKTIDYDKCAQFILGVIYYEFQVNINEAIRYFTLSAEQNYPQSQFILSEIYSRSELGKVDYQKSIHYLTRASNLNFREAQFKLGLLYYEGQYVQRNINKGILLMTLSAKQYFTQANFVLGFLYQEGKFIKQDIDKAIRFYKEASSFNDQYSKNNLGYLFRMQNKINYSIELFKEAIYQNDDVLASYNLANIYFYDGIVKDNINEAIKILILPSKRNFYPAQLLLSLALISKVGFDINIIKKEIDEIVKSDQFSANIINIIQTNKLNSDSEYEFFNTFLSTIFILYNYSYCAIESFRLFKEEQSNKTNLIEINSRFYEGFGF